MHCEYCGNLDRNILSPMGNNSKLAKKKTLQLCIINSIFSSSKVVSS